MNKPKCPVSGCPATKFGMAAIENNSPQHIGDKSVFVLQCDQGHIISADSQVDLRALFEHQNSILREMLKVLREQK
jgi:hypothetical protein